MARFIMKGAALTLVIALTGSAVLYLPGGYLHELAAIINKRNILAHRKPPRLIFIGGSNLLSLNGPMVERELKMPVVNMGLFAQIPLEDYFDDIARYFSPGDIVVVVQEYHSLMGARRGPIPESAGIMVEQFMFLLSPQKYALRSLQRCAPFDITRICVSLIQLKLKSFIKFTAAGKFAEAVKPGVPRFDYLFDENGDARSSFLVIRPLLGKGEIYPKPGPENITHLRHMIEAGKKKGVRVFFSFPPLPESDFDLNLRQITGLYDIMKKNILSSLINTPADHCYPNEYFADTVNHLHIRGEQIRSRKLVEELKSRVIAEHLVKE